MNMHEKQTITGELDEIGLVLTEVSNRLTRLMQTDGPRASSYARSRAAVNEILLRLGRTWSEVSNVTIDSGRRDREADNRAAIVEWLGISGPIRVAMFEEVKIENPTEENHPDEKYLPGQMELFGEPAEDNGADRLAIDELDRRQTID